MKPIYLPGVLSIIDDTIMALSPAVARVIANRTFTAMTSWRYLLACGILALSLSHAVTPAQAHAQLVQATPRVGSTVSGSPSEIRLQFSEAIEPRFSRIDVVNVKGQKVETGGAVVDPGDSSQLVVRTNTPLAPGAYRVNWQVLSVDTHQTHGSFTFEVRP